MVLSSTSLIGSGTIAPTSSNYELPELPKVQIWASASDVVNNNYVSIDKLVQMIIERELDSSIISLRQLNIKEIDCKDKELKKEYKFTKNRLPLITFTFHLKDYRDENHLNYYTGYIVLDADLKENPNLPLRIKNIKRNISDCPYTFLMFDSPRGEGFGLKVVLRTFLNSEIVKCNEELKKEMDNKKRKNLIDTIKDFHFQVHKRSREYYSNKFDLLFDQGAKNFQGVCFLSGDSNIYYNPNSSLLKIVWAKKEKETTTFNTYNDFNFSTTSNNDILEAILKDFIKNCSGRNSATFLLAVQAKYYNISENEILNFVMNKWGDDDFNQKEALRAIRNGFKYTPYVQYIFNNNNSNNL
ncbi:MAG: hypothetical protein H6Q16_1249 [Bacteroidetes bacterium]|nr:hypothetical protein [Bacteroidota bacterium]